MSDTQKMKKRIADMKPGIIEQRNCNNCKWKSVPGSYPNWNKHTLKCINHPGIKYFDWEPILSIGRINKHGELEEVNE